jgi:hypothetical protein
MKRYPTSLDPAHLYLKVKDLPTTVDDGNVHMAYVQGTSLDKITLDPYVRKAIEEIEGISGLKAISLMVNTLDPKMESPIHTDPGTFTRYHLPLLTNERTIWMDEQSGVTEMKQGFWYGPVPYTVPHRVGNYGETPRIHLIVDLQ